MIAEAKSPVFRGHEQEQRRYKMLIQRFADKNDPVIFQSKDLDEAAIVMSEILRHAKDEVRIYDHCLNGNISDRDEDFFVCLYQFLDKGKKLKIVLRDPVQPNSRLTRMLTEYSRNFMGKINIKYADENFVSNVCSNLGQDVNFVVNDNNAFRLELSQRSETNDEEHKFIEAICSFNNPKMNKELTKAFDDCFVDCKELKLKL